MILDERTEFADAVALNTGAAGTYNVGDIIDSSVARDLGQKPVYLVIQVTTAVTSVGAATVSFQIASDATSTISTTTQTIHYTSMAIPKASLVAGYQLVIPLPAEMPAYERYLAVQQITGVAALTAGAINAFLTLDPNGNKSYPDGAN